jgi:hypothetical protein
MYRRALIALSALTAASLACSIFLGGPAYPDPPVPISTEAATGLQSAFRDAMQNAAQTGTLTVELTESELTSFLQSKLSEQADPPITQPQVTLRDGALKVFGTTQTGIFVANVSLTAQFSVDQNGQPQITITQVDYGPFPAPSELTDALGSLLRESLTGSFGPAALGFRLEKITVADGKLTLTGRIK